MRIPYYMAIGGLVTVLISFGIKSGCLPSSDPQPKLLGVWENNSNAALQGFVVQGHTVFAIESGGGRLIYIDISVPSQPREIGSVDLLRTALDITIKENYIYTVGGGYLEIFDISNPSSPQRVGSLDLESALLAVELKENILYAFNEGENREILLIDVSNPTDPKFIQSVTVRQDYPVFNIHINGTLAFLANSGGGISVLDIENPLNPIFLSSFDPEGGVVWDVETKEQFIYFPQSPGPEADFTEFFVVDASDTIQMELVTSLEIGRRESFGKSIAIEGSIAAIAMQEIPTGHVVLVDISDPRSPQEKGNAEIPSELRTFQGDIEIQNGLIIVSGVDGLAIYEIVYE